MARGINTKQKGIDFRANRFDEFLKLIPQNLTDAEKAQVLANLGITAEVGSLEGAVRYDALQELNDTQKSSARSNVDLDDILQEHGEGHFYVTDESGNVIFKIGEDGASSVNFKSKNGIELSKTSKNDWLGKTIAFYGDSVTAQCNGDYSEPYSDYDGKWALVTANYYKMSCAKVRGIGGQGYKWITAGGNGGSLSWVDETTGRFVGRKDGTSYDEWVEDPTIQEIPEGCVATRGCMASWLRITSMFPSQIKDEIDVVVVMAHNDSDDEVAVNFVENDVTDTEWANSDVYSEINGDYNISSSFRGALCSTIMKLQLWMPNAVIVIATGISGRGDVAGEILPEINQTSPIAKAEAVREVGKLASVPVVDTFATDGINGWNRPSYISDSIHPNSSGNNMLARAVIGGMKSILPRI